MSNRGRSGASSPRGGPTGGASSSPYVNCGTIGRPARNIAFVIVVCLVIATIAMRIAALPSHIIGGGVVVRRDVVVNVAVDDHDDYEVDHIDTRGGRDDGSGARLRGGISNDDASGDGGGVGVSPPSSEPDGWGLGRMKDVGSSASEFIVATTEKVENRTTTTMEEEEENDDHDIMANIPIHLVDTTSSSSSSSSAVIDYGSLMSMWDRNTTYDDILERARNAIPRRRRDDSHMDDLRGQLRHLHNVTVIHHTSPKMASSTLRGACMDEMNTTCPIIPPKPAGWKMPEGYRTPVRLVQLFGLCPKTRHFCVMGYIPLTRSYAGHYHNRTFLHMFPYRNYDSWARSALHQISYREGEDGCRKMDELLDECLPHRYELNFEMYTKSSLVEYARSYLRVANVTGLGMDIVGDRHRALLYDHRYLHETLGWLYDDGRKEDDDDDRGNGGVSRLAGTDRRINTANTTLESGLPRVQIEPCANEGTMLEKFHDCFSDDLGTLF